MTTEKNTIFARVGDALTSTNLIFWGGPRGGGFFPWVKSTALGSYMGGPEFFLLEAKGGRFFGNTSKVST